MKPYFVLAMLTLMVSACAWQVGTSSTEPLSTLDFAIYPTTTLVQINPHGVVATRGFEIRGWT